MDELSWTFIYGPLAGLALTIGLTWLVVSRRASRRSVTGGWIPLACLCVVGAVGLFLVVRLVGPRRADAPSGAPLFQSAIHRAAGHTAEMPSEVASRNSGSTQVAVDASEIWRDVVDEQFDTNIYPSTILAARALGRQVAAHVSFSVLAKDASPTDIKVIDGFGLDDASQAAEALAGQLRAEFEVPTNIHPAHFQIPARISSPGEVLVILRMPRQQTRVGAPWGNSSRERAGTIQATVMGQRNSVSVATQFVDKPWVSQFDEFISRRPNSTFLLARTAKLCGTEQAAHLEANDRAAESVSKMITPLVLSAAGPGEIRSDIQAQLRSTSRWLISSGHLVKDRFAQKLTRPYGEVWREAVLVELTPTQINGLRSYAIEISQNRHRQSVTFHGGLLALFALVICLYVFLNQATKGYYRAKLAAWLSGGLVAMGLVFTLIWQAWSQPELVHGFPRSVPHSSTASTPIVEMNRDSSPVRPVTPVSKPLRQTEAASPLPAKPVVTPPLDEAEPKDGGVDPVPIQGDLSEVNQAPNENP